ncbi:MAG: amidohydrolase family protein [Planctomycetes bacterium]|nr:amidohydrolase family protein [Planctomycetota bacterium]
MHTPLIRPAWLRWIFFAALLLPTAAAAPPVTTPTEGIADNTPAVHALVGGRIVVAPGRVIERGTLVVRDGVIVAVGVDVKPPADARVWKLDGKTIYAGLIDAYSELTGDAATKAEAAVAKGKGSGGYWNVNVVPQTRAGAFYAADAALNKKFRSQGVTARLIAPTAGVIKGTSAIVSTGDDDPSRTVIKQQVALHAKLTVKRGDRKQYPNSPMGAVALFRQAFYDAQWYTKAWRAYDGDPLLARPERNAALEVLQHYPQTKLPVVIDASNERYFLRADRFGREFGLNVIVRGSGREYRRLEAIRRSGRAVIVPLNFAKAPNVATPEAALGVSLSRLMHWDIAPENPARLDRAGVTIALTAHGLSDPGKLLAAVRTAIERGLPADSALRALTTTPAKLLGVDDRLGTLETGKAASFVITDGDLFAKKTKLLETWVDGRRYEVVKSSDVDVRGTWQVTIQSPAGKQQTVTLHLSGKPGSLSGEIVRGKAKHKLRRAGLLGSRFSCTLNGKSLGVEGIVRLSAVISEETDGRMTWLGSVTWADGSQTACTARRTSTEVPKEDTPPEDKKKNDKKPEVPKKALYEVNFPLGASGRSAPPAQPAAVLFRNATIWTSGKQGTLSGASILVKSGKIAAVGKNIIAPKGAIVVDATGLHITPGLIDCHSHIATDGGINESAQAVTAEVRIGDFIDAGDINIYRQLAGGVTSSNILHGSANPIGGQNQVIKMRWGSLPEEIKFAQAPPGIKFALGENVKQSNWGDDYRTRYPQTRMGVEQIMLDRFRAAGQYDRRWSEWRKSHQGLPPRVDLELEALAEVVAGKRWIHCHSYRQDEILALMRTCEKFGITIGTFQHVLEGYKVASEMAAHGAMGSAFSDWWAYKFEVYDAIPYNGAIMHNAGVVVSFNSDSGELARRLNVEATKAVKYGGVPPEEALKFVTLNPAKQLRIDQYVGSIEVGKHADLAVWNKSPLSTFARCEQTWVDGRKYFDRGEDIRRRAEDRRRHAALVQRILSSGAEMLKAGEKDPAAGELWPREDIFCHHGDHGHEGHGH